MEMKLSGKHERGPTKKASKRIAARAEARKSQGRRAPGQHSKRVNRRAKNPAMVPVFRPLIEAEEIAASRAALELGWLGMGSYVNEFEEGLREFFGARDRYVAAVSTGHAALHLALIVAGVGRGDEVITPSFNNVTDFQAILALDAKPVFCDIEDATLCIDFDKAEELVTPRTRAIIAMDYDCVLCDHARAAEFARKHSVRVVHDAAHAFGSKYRGQKIGSFSDLCMFSFDPVKTLTCIDGGALVVRTKEELARIHEMRLVGMSQPASLMYQNQRAWTYDVARLGFRYHMANLHAAIGLAQLRKMGRISETRRAACRRYNLELGGIAGLHVPQTDFDDVTPFLYYVRVEGGRRDEFRAFLHERGVDTGIHWQPGHWFTLLKDCRRGKLEVTERVGHEIVSLPLHSAMEEASLERVIEAVKEFFKS
ncbi:MAG TPA: DegT/DnrJ/EryC1/StrS family aminotransferase [Candidatus Acidoferrales bacterium]|nr:DegT/DnrJ/EryC1/StrS family aminotransferase [Candidatus Acidoferrales bacterium]